MVIATPPIERRVWIIFEPIWLKERHFMLGKHIPSNLHVALLGILALASTELLVRAANWNFSIPDLTGFYAAPANALKDCLYEQIGRAHARTPAPNPQIQCL